MGFVTEAILAWLLGSSLAVGLQSSPGTKQPKVQPGPSEPDWLVILDRRYGLDMFADLRNPVNDDVLKVPGLFRKAGPGPVRFVPEIALGLEVLIHGGFYERREADGLERSELWSYRHKSTAAQLEHGEDLTPPLLPGSQTTFDPGDREFGLFISNDEFHDTVYSEPSLVAALNPRLAKQPYKAMIYPYRDRKSGQLVPHTYLIGWEYSTNDDFQDVVCRVENVELIGPGGAP
jgi:hypothetical protein